VVTTDVKLVTKSVIEYAATLKTSKALPAGTHTTNLEVRVCEDEPQVCAKPFPGSPWRVPVSVTVKPQSTLSQQGVIPGVPAWSTYQGNAAHNGFVPATFDPAKFSRRWTIPASNALPSAAVIDNGKAFVVRGNSLISWRLEAINEDTGETAWSVDFGKLDQVNDPAAANGKVYLTSTGKQDSFFWVFDQGTGRLLSKTPMTLSGLGYHYYAPTVFEDKIYTGSDHDNGGVSKFSDPDGRLEWQSRMSNDWFEWTPAVDSTYVYGFISGTLTALRKTDGRSMFNIGTPFSAFSGTGLVLGDQMAYAPSHATLFGFDLAKQSIAWSFDNLPRGMPALSKDTLYTLAERGTRLEARATTTGALKWTANVDDVGCNMCSVVATNKHIFVSLDIETLAIDIDSHAVVWRHPLGGKLAISNRGVLYIVNPNSGQIAAINLQ
jgi:hypothetical protein